VRAPVGSRLEICSAVKTFIGSVYLLAADGGGAMALILLVTTRVSKFHFLSLIGVYHEVQEVDLELVMGILRTVTTCDMWSMTSSQPCVVLYAEIVISSSSMAVEWVLGSP